MSVFRIGGFYRFTGVNPGDVAHIFARSDRQLKQHNAVWLPSGAGCHVTVGADVQSDCVEVPEDEITDRMWEALGKAALAGELL